MVLDKVRVESPYSRPTRRLFCAPTPLGALAPADHDPFIVRPKGVRDIPSGGREYGTNGILEGHDFSSGYCLCNPLQPPRLSLEEEKVRSDLCPSPAAAAESRIRGELATRPIEKDRDFMVNKVTWLIAMVLDHFVIIWR